MERCKLDNTPRTIVSTHEQTKSQMRKPSGLETTIAALKLCGNTKDLQTGRKIHRDVLDSGEFSNIYIATTLVHMYTKCESVSEASKVFYSMGTRNTVSWNCMILGYVETGDAQFGLELYRRMQDCEPNHVTFLAALKACTSLAGDEPNRGASLEHGRSIHFHSARSGQDAHSRVANALLKMYATCGSMVYAAFVFHGMHDVTVISWTEMILGYAAESGSAVQALRLYIQMQEQYTPDSVTFVAALKACSGVESNWVSQMIREIHSQAVRAGYDVHLFVANTLMSVYVKCGCLTHAQEVFDKMVTLDTVSWNSVISGCAECEREEQALETFTQMRREGFERNYITILSATKACVKMAEKERGNANGVKSRSLRIGKRIHSQAGEHTHLSVMNSLVDMYVKCGSMVDAQELFECMPEKDVVMWTVIIRGYLERGENQKVLEMYARMKESRCKPALSVLLAAVRTGDCLETARSIHRDAVDAGCERNMFMACSLIDLYSNCGSLAEARQVFESMPEKNVVAWSSIILGSVENGEPSEALGLYRRMRAENRVAPDGVMYLGVLKSCASLGLLENGKEVIAEIDSTGLRETDTVLCNCVLDFYGKCGCMDEAAAVFQSMKGRRTVVSWNALIDGFTRGGKCESAISTFERLRTREDANVEPNEVSYLLILTLCSHAGLVEEGKEYFRGMVWESGFKAGLKHYACVVDLLARANRLEEAIVMVRNMPYEPNSAMWMSILSSCSKWKNVEIGKVAFDALNLLNEPFPPAAYVLISDIYASK